ncbi:MAG: hypothetical protein PUD33_01580, partial [Treponema sp.]|nr:hypothetical protein [Treponema sp.]
ANETQFENFKKLFDSVLKEISLDFSTQSHFGKIWQKNIIKNIFLKKKTGRNLHRYKKNCLHNRRRTEP